MTGADDAVGRIVRLIPEWAAGRDGPLVVGICGAQGSGKSTVAAALARRLSDRGHIVAVLSLDDLYLSRARRRDLANHVHPLFATRGVPGTHDVALGRQVIADLVAGRAVALPRFDKAADEPLPAGDWPWVAGNVDAILFEGWCVAAVAQGEAALRIPVNRLEAEEDAQGRWRSHVDAVLGESYPALFAAIDRLVMLAAPGFDVVLRWRRDQEHALRRQRRSLPDAGAAHIMTDDGIDRFVAHYERLTRFILAEMPSRADLVLHLDESRRVVAERRGGAPPGG